MDAIRKFTITGMTLSGFKSYGERTELHFGDPTVITGGNGRGKSSIADAIAFAVLGVPFFGERGIDRLHGEENGDIFISMRFLDENGVEHELVRTRQKSRMTITLDGREQRQLDLTELFGEKDVFLSIFNPLYFIEELGEEGRKLLERYLPEIPAETVLSQLPDTTRAALTEDLLRSPDTGVKNTRGEIRELENSVIYLTGQKDYALRQKTEAEARVAELTEQLASLQSEADTLENRRFEGMDLAEMEEQLSGLSARYEELARESPDTETGKRIEELRRKLAVRSAERYEPKYAQQIMELSSGVMSLAKQHQRESGVLRQFRPGTVCPTCRRPVTERDLPTVQTEYQKVLAAIVKEGKAQRTKLNELVALEKQTEETFLQFQAEDVAQLDRDIAGLEKRRERENADRQSELDALLTKIRGLSADMECGALSPAEYNRLGACREALRSKSAELDAARTVAESVADDYDAQIRDVESKIAEKKRLLTCLAAYISKRVELTFTALSMNRVQISLFDVVKSTGELKDVFKFTYNGRRYDRLSLSEKIRAGLEVSELVKRLTGRNYPVFVDNMESVDDLANVRPTSQVIMAKCVHGAALSVRPAGKPQQTIPQAA